jgi:CubicO group peptidase (beta-lactamase class C family)
MPITLARWISILWHPLPAIAVSVLLAALLAGRLQQGLDTLLPIAALLLSVLGFIGWQTWRGRWTHVDASVPAERRGLNRFLLIGLMLASLIAALSDAAPELSFGLAAAASCMAVVSLCARWLKISQHSLFAVLPLAWLWPSMLASAVFVVMAVLVAASRLRLRRHTLAEVFCGLVLGGAAAFALVLIAPSPPAFKPELSSCSVAAERNDGWAVGPMPAAAAARLCLALQRQIDAGANLHALLIEQGGRLRFEAYTRGVDRPINALLPRLSAFGPATTHDLRSISKSVLGLLVLIAHAEGELPSLQRAVLDYFPEYADLRGGALDQLQLVHLLNMSIGLAWDESGSYASLSNSETRMRLSRDPLRYVLTRAPLAAPGTRFAYGGGNSAVLAEVLERATGQTLGEYAQAKLFSPLGITHADWVRDRHGKALAYSGLRLSARDLARIGRLLLDRGRWQGRQVLPTAAVQSLFEPVIETGDGLRYSHQWWLSPSAVEPAWSAAFGNGGQRLYLLPALDMSVVILAGDYNRPNQGRAARALLQAATAAADPPTR